MYTMGYDETAVALVAIRGPGGDDNEEFLELMSALERLADDANARGVVGRYLLLIKAGTTPPSAWERMGHATIIGQKADLRLALVTRSPAFRSVLTALGRAVPEFGARSASFATVEEAATWLQKTSSQDSGALRRLLAQVETAALRTQRAG
jgi:hypothetical protein